MRAIFTIVFIILATLANTKEPVNPLAFPLLVESENIPLEPYKKGDVFFCFSERHISKKLGAYEFKLDDTMRKLNLKIYDENTLAFGDNGLLKGQANIKWLNSEFGSFKGVRKIEGVRKILGQFSPHLHAHQYSTETDLHLVRGKKDILTIIEWGLDLSIYSFQCEEF